MRILIADNHTLFSQGLRSLVERQADFEVVAEARDGREALEQCRELRPDVVLMDVVMPGLNGLEATRQIRQETPATRILALSMHIDKRYVLGMLEAGASGYLAKDAPFDEVARALRAVAAGHVYLAPAIAGVVVENVARRTSPVVASTAPDLSQREREVLQLLAEGCTARQVARQLHIGIKTVETHRRNMLRKLQLDNIADLVRYAIREGITSLDEA
ncbi:MAG: response regulator transcription factor [Kofleriaceae bacterium]|nr:response regulator transcription factor [Kofleriaceae bacterium]